jgi:ribosomal protein S18 acetylase RimI-like enzyme
VISLRPVLQAEDDEFLCEVYGSTRQAELDLVDWDDEEKAAFVRMQFDAQCRHYAEFYAGTFFLVIVVDGEPAGRLYVARWPDEIRIVDIALLPAYRGRGIGSALLQELLAEGAASGKPVTIHVEKLNPAMRLYERLGFSPIADKGVYLLMGRPPSPSLT